ncbi:MAG TPA: hypothetical protein VFI80_02735 [Burkholderiales bacterium]|nr:hypothetical protein [Burkholderiales bacterium]
MKRFSLIFMSLFGLLLAAQSASAAFIVRVGDTVYVDGKQYSWEEWKKIRDDPELVKQSLQSPSPPAQQSPGPPAPQSAAAAPARPRAASCATAIYYDEFPSEDERFECSAGLGPLTREQIMQNGWKVDFVEKIPPPQGQPAQSPRGLPLYLYKLVISR